MFTLFSSLLDTVTQPAVWNDETGQHTQNWAGLNLEMELQRRCHKGVDWQPQVRGGSVILQQKVRSVIFDESTKFWSCNEEINGTCCGKSRWKPKHRSGNGASPLLLGVYSRRLLILLRYLVISWSSSAFETLPVIVEIRADASCVNPPFIIRSSVHRSRARSVFFVCVSCDR